MKRRISIGLDMQEIIRKIEYAIDDYENETGKIACLCMSQHTADSLPIPVVNLGKFIEKIKRHDGIIETIEPIKPTGFVCEWEGTKIEIDNKLDFGEIIIV